MHLRNCLLLEWVYRLSLHFAFLCNDQNGEISCGKWSFSYLEMLKMTSKNLLLNIYRPNLSFLLVLIALYSFCCVAYAEFRQILWKICKILKIYIIFALFIKTTCIKPSTMNVKLLNLLYHELDEIESGCFLEKMYFGKY